jgi:hypothetical protein
MDRIARSDARKGSDERLRGDGMKLENCAVYAREWMGREKD